MEQTHGSVTGTRDRQRVGTRRIADALRLLQDGAAVDLLVTDHLMPGMSGTELAREVRPMRPVLPILVVSGYAEVDGIAADLPRLVKPFRARELAEQVTAIMPGDGVYQVRDLRRLPPTA